ncbi:MAG: T9SS type A sorting domain-containing protein [Saprospiraceae bacterium]|nr:T9SS type A sorting domain-containing protein [Candidatus Vicinibacter affinis]MBK6574205.1 T9SS type A sorting domain-containing protein [Candidatus Vicinibacter affinis]MBK7798392.1 T9SS type A sorting domain-containing protein [Candidatus Vicinibacter affinis]MBK8643398.1 T9SS type A sorting domain-containing protein [Candidatus Vicinibacter affinis]MBK9641516.1 T9SS type A sorting domain-containing protein [Candidatus Vicinibacter affinis]
MYEHNLNTTIPIKNALKNFQSESLKFHLFPNPTEEILYIKTPHHAKILPDNIEIIALDGKTYFTPMAASQSNHIFKIEIGFLTPGIYFIKFKTTNGEVVMKKFVKK